MTQLDNILDEWQLPEFTSALKESITEPDLTAVASICRLKLTEDIENRKDWQITISEWLYQLVRRNVKRGRAYELEEVLTTGQADCLGYAKLFSAIAPRFGLELGIVEVLVDNMGHYVPHHANLLNLIDGTRRFMDAWYGFTNIYHQRIGALANGQPEDIDLEQISRIEDLKGLPDRCIEAITLYIRANRHLDNDELDQAIEYYSAAINQYPNNNRAFYNRAIAYERQGETEKARDDYARALQDRRSLIRLLAQIDEMEGLIRLDELGIKEEEQDIYLWHKGFKTGEMVGFEKIAEKYGVPTEDVREIITRVESLCIS